MNRKEFIRKGMQISILSGMAAGIGFLVSRNQLNYSCETDQQCKACTKYNQCDLEKAEKFRQHEQ